MATQLTLLHVPPSAAPKLKHAKMGATTDSRKLAKCERCFRLTDPKRLVWREPEPGVIYHVCPPCDAILKKMQR